MKAYDVYFEQVNAQKITVAASTPQAAARKAMRQVKTMHPELIGVEWDNHRLKEGYHKGADELGVES